jgi:hypothetical protein
MVRQGYPRGRRAWVQWIRQGPWRASLIWAVATVLTTPVWLMSLPLVMVFDAPGSSENPWLWLMLSGILGLPLLCALTPLLLWLLYGLGGAWPLARPRLRCLGHSAHALPMFSPFTVVVSLIGLQLFCGGNFACHP